MNQTLCVEKTVSMFHNDIKEILWVHVQRSGKSYMIAGTISEYIHVFNCCQLSDVSVINLGNCHSKPQNKKNIIICSKQQFFTMGKRNSV